jgi:hypothetical protein
VEFTYCSNKILATLQKHHMTGIKQQTNAHDPSSNQNKTVEV